MPIVLLKLRGSGLPRLKRTSTESVEETLEWVRELHSRNLDLAFRAGIAVRVIKKYNLDDPTVSTEDRDRWIQEFSHRTNKPVYKEKK
jgi:hypothetical protein